MNKNPIFIVSSGRSGSQLFHKLFSTIKHINANHEFNIMSYKPEIVKFMNSGSNQDLKDLNESLNNNYYNYIDKESEKIWQDSNYSIAPILDILLKKYPDAKIIHLVRSGLKVASSWFNKLGDEIYGDIEVKNLQEYLLRRDPAILPLREKKNWWYIPSNRINSDINFNNLSQFERICYHWVFSYSWINEHKNFLSKKENYKIIKLEDVVNSEISLKSLFDLLEIDYKVKYFISIQVPHNVNKPINFQLTPEQHKKFIAICGNLMSELGYDIYDQYKVNYKKK
jgi:hypothetical protein